MIQPIMLRARHIPIAAMLVLASCGDDPPSAVEVYERVFRQPRPESVSKIQYQVGPGRDRMLRLAVETSDMQLAERSADSPSLAETETFEWG